MKQITKILWGFVLIFIGIILALNTLEITNINLFFDGWWTLFIIIPSLIGLFNDKDKTGNIIGIIIGVLLLLACQKLIDFELILKLMLPIILIMIGISFIFKDILNSSVKKQIKKLNNNQNEQHHCATFGGVDANYSNEEFKGCDLTAVFGGIKCDLTDAIIKEDVVINVTTIFGGIDIKVPENINVKVSSTPIFGGVDNKIKNKKEDNTKTIYINATCIFGGVDIK